MNKSKRDAILQKMVKEDWEHYRGIMKKLRADMLSSPRRRVPVRELLAAGSVEVTPRVRAAVDAVVARHETGPKIGEAAIDFTLKRLASEEWVRLGSFFGKRPIGLIFGSYT